MDQASYRQNMDFVSQAVAYNRYLVDSVRPYLGDRVLDVGCGVGNTTMLLERPFVVGMDVSDHYLGELRARLPDVELICDDIAGEPDLERLRSYRFDTIFCSNVLEHIEDDRAALRNMREVLVPGGVLVLLVPQYPSLFGAMDAEDLHFRRYDKPSLREKLSGAGFALEREFSVNLPGIFWWFFAGRILRRSTGGESEAGLIDSVIPVVRLVDRLARNRAGLSLVEVARK